MNVTDDKQTDHAVENCVDISEIINIEWCHEIQLIIIYIINSQKTKMPRKQMHIFNQMLAHAATVSTNMITKNEPYK